MSFRLSFSTKWTPQISTKKKKKWTPQIYHLNIFKSWNPHGWLNQMGNLGKAGLGLIENPDGIRVRCRLGLRYPNWTWVPNLSINICRMGSGYALYLISEVSRFSESYVLWEAIQTQKSLLSTVYPTHSKLHLC